MDLSVAMRLVMVRAQTEAQNMDVQKVYPEHISLGILKLPELSIHDTFRTFDNKAEIETDIQSVKSQLEQKAIYTAEGRQRLRRALRMSEPPGDANSAVSELLAKASKQGSRNVIYASDVLQILLNEPTPIIKVLFINPDDVALNKPNKRKSAKKLASLTERVAKMQYALLKSVRGQDHAVRTFADGIFNAEVMADSGNKRNQPKAIFLFAGPPGVGKTYLAQEASKSLALPFRQFDMSNFSDHQAHSNLIGFNPSYKAAKPGLLSGFVKDNPNCILLFDEIEKAHLNTIHLFLQILDAGTLHDDFLDESVSFNDTFIIFTTNAGRQLYETGKNLSDIARQTILEAVGADTDSRGNPFFPAAICSRLAMGYPVMFNHLQTHELVAIAQSELNRMAMLFYQQFDVRISMDNLLASVILFSEGGLVDARTLRAQTELFFKNEVFKLCRLWGQDKLADAFIQIDKLHFSAEDNFYEDLRSLFGISETPQISFFGQGHYAEILKSNLPEFNILVAADVETAMKIVGENDLLFVLLEVSVEGNIQPSGTIAYFERVPVAAASLQPVNELLRTINERLPDLPVYLLDTGNPNIDDELEAAFVQKSARGKHKWSANDISVLTDEITYLSIQLHLQGVAASLAAESKILSFETAPKLSKNEREATIRLREFYVRRSVRGGDSDNVLDETERPSVKFADVIGARTAKEELQFFVNYIRNPKKFFAQGLKPPKGVLLYGPPGTGKTLLAKAMAGESDVAYIPAVGSGFVTRWQGSGPKAVRELFNRARRYAPAIIFIDEIDAIGRTRGQRQVGHGEEMALNALLAGMDGFTFDPKHPVFVLAATNFDVEEGKGGIGTIDAALARRFDRKILVDLPDKSDRKQFLEIMINKQINNEVTLEMIERLAKRSTGLSLANLSSVIEFAVRMAVKNKDILNDACLEEAFETTLHGEKKDWGREYLECVACHEAGHAYMCHLAGTTPAYLTIVARGNHGGYMEHADTETRPVQTKRELLEKIRTTLGGRAAEIVYYGEQEGLSSGAGGDLKYAAKVAKIIVCNYGMDDEIGFSALLSKEIGDGVIAEKVANRISELMKELFDETVQKITEGKVKIDSLVEALLEKNKMSSEEIISILD